MSNVVSKISDWLNIHCVDSDTVGELELVLAEVLNNVVELAYLYAEDGDERAVADAVESVSPTRFGRAHKPA